MASPQSTTSTPIPLQFTRLGLFSMAALGFYTLQYTARTNGLFPQMERVLEAAKLGTGPLSDGVTMGANLKFTGIAPIDHLAGFVLMFFWPIIDGNNIGLSLASAGFGAAGAAVWALMMVEGRRRGGGWTSYTLLVCMLGQLFGLGVIGPIYLFLYTWSPIFLHPTPQSLLPTSITSIAVIPATVTISYILPAIVMCLPAGNHPTALITLDQKLLAQNLWQISPLTSGLIVHPLLSSIWPYNPKPTTDTTLSYLRHIYKFALCVAVPIHIATMSLSLSAFLFPTLFASGVADQLLLENAIVPSMDVIHGVAPRTIAEGALWFIQWDYALVGASFLVWAIGCRQVGRKAAAGAAVAAAGGTVAATAAAAEKGVEKLGAGGVLKIVVRMCLWGPVAAAVVYIWERDEVVLGAGRGKGLGDGMERKKIQ